MRCPSCGGSELTHETRYLPFTHKDHALTVPAQSGLYCPACGEAVFDEAETLRYAAVAKPFVQGVNAEAVPDIRAIRKKLSLTQAEAGRLFGGGVNAFSRYERHEVEPPLVLVNLLKLLKRHPELVGEMQGSRNDRLCIGRQVPGRSLPISSKPLRPLLPSVCIASVGAISGQMPRRSKRPGSRPQFPKTR